MIKISLLVSLSLIAMLTASATNTNWVDKKTVLINTWNPFIIAGTDQIEETFTYTLNSSGILEVQDVRCTSDRTHIVLDDIQLVEDPNPYVYMPYQCNDQETHPELAQCNEKYWRRVISIPSGTHTLKFPTIRSPLNRGVAYFRLREGSLNESQPILNNGRFFVSRLSPVSSRTEAISQCESQDATLADLECQDFVEARNVVLNSELERNMYGLYQTWISTWNSDSYGQANIAYQVNPNELSLGAVGLQSTSTQLYPLCKRNVPKIPIPTTNCPTQVTFSSPLQIHLEESNYKLKLIGPIDDYMMYTSVCKSLGLVPWYAKNNNRNEWLAATKLVLDAELSSAWLFGFDEPSNLPMQLIPVPMNPDFLGQIVPAVDNSAKLMFLCQGTN